MNERIKELAEQAASDYNDANGVFIPDDFIEKFAELIVRECADFVRDTATIETLLGDRLKEYFGVEA